jgi:hypothetical protein
MIFFVPAPETYDLLLYQGSEQLAFHPCGVSHGVSAGGVSE